MTDITYPVRCQIVDADGKPLMVPGMMMRTPAASRPHIGKKGLAEWVSVDWGANTIVDGVRITLDDGSILYGHECWWIPIEESKDA